MSMGVQGSYSFGIVHSPKEEASDFKKISNLSKAATVVSIVGTSILVASSAVATTLSLTAMTIGLLGIASPAIIGIVSAVAIATLAVGVIIATTVLTAALIIHIINEVKRTQHICKYSGTIETNGNDLLNPSAPGKCTGLPTKDCSDTLKWKYRLLKAAEHNILISGNYFGNKTFCKFLVEIEKQMDAKPKLLVSLLGAPNHLSEQNKEKLGKLQLKYGNRFSFIDSPLILHTGNTPKISTNHTKCMVVDYGKYFILGGSGIKDNFSKVGITSEDALNGENEAGFLPNCFRDMDFVFRADDRKPEKGKDLYRQMLLLNHRWEQYYINKENNRIVTKLKKDELGIFSDVQTAIKPEDSVTMQLLKSPIPEFSELTTKVKKFDTIDTIKGEITDFQVLSSGPEHSNSVFAETILEQIKKAQSRIVINHMYFHPTKKIQNALIEAANRGVEITIITTGLFDNSLETAGWCPRSHHTFVPRNRQNYTDLYYAIDPDKRENIKIHEFEQYKVGLHKKALIIDNTVIAGSSNLGTKSLVTTSDYEINFIATSETFANETYAIFKKDLEYSPPIVVKPLSSMTKLRAYGHEKIGFAIG